MLGSDYATQDCSIARTLEVVGERWTLLLLRDAFLGVRRFNDFQTRLDVPRAVLADRLRHLVAEGVMERRPDREDGRRVLYELTPTGRELWPVLYGMLVWGGRHRASPHRRRRYRHATCGTELDARAACPACGVAPAPEDVVTWMQARPSAPPDKDRVSAALQAPRRLLEPLGRAA
jgi:DNA-binding HxlR family transcriptional regulator